MTSRLVGSPRSSSSMEALPESIQVRQSFLSSSSVECGSSTGILLIPTESQFSSPSGVLRFWLVGIPMTLPRSGSFTNHIKSFIRFSYVICVFTHCIVELVFALSYIRSHVWWSIEYSGTRCGDYSFIPRKLTALIGWKILNSAVDEVSQALSLHMAPRPYRLLWYPHEWQSC
jgi:hypothetical protein